MFILINGSFGIGKTTIAQLLCWQVPRAVLSDPEQIGYVLRRLPPWLIGRTCQPDDYQDLALWRRLIVWQAQFTHWQAQTVVVPMAFSNLAYFEAFKDALSRTATVKAFCLVAPLDVIRARLAQRAVAEGRDLSAFEMKRSAECAVAHTSPAFGLPIDATGTPTQTLAALSARLQQQT